ncbi:hypothetical protein CCP3SC15_1930007 [Gammaproteobacteria bacterium]
MSKWKGKLQPPHVGPIHQGCLNCPPVERLAPMDMIIAVGFGIAQVTRGKKIVFHEGFDDREYHTLSEFEEKAANDPDHDWRVYLNAPLRSREYQRQGVGKWVLIASGEGFA